MFLYIYTATQLDKLYFWKIDEQQLWQLAIEPFACSGYVLLLPPAVRKAAGQSNLDVFWSQMAATATRASLS